MCKNGEKTKVMTMKNLKVPDFVKDIGIIFCTSIIPAVVNFGIFKLFWNNTNGDETFELISAIITSIIAFFAVLVFYYILASNRRFRLYREYEGRWLQIIPRSDYDVSVIELKYLRQSHQYVLTGLNFNKNNGNSVSFIANKFVKRDNNDGFYYITNYTFQHKNSLGKIGFINDNIDNLTRAEGYFFDASTEQCSRKYNTIMIKCDKKFFSYIKPHFSEIDFDKLSAKTIAEISRELVNKECNIYNEQINANKERAICRENCRNKSCQNEDPQQNS